MSTRGGLTLCLCKLVSSRQIGAIFCRRIGINAVQIDAMPVQTGVKAVQIDSIGVQNGVIAPDRQRFVSAG